MNIKFRGQRVDDKGWVYGYVVPLGKLSFSDPDRFGIVEEAIPVGFASIAYNLEIIEVIPETVGQYTGLKDKNGVEIYEGDILKTIALLNDHNQRGATVVSPVEYWCGATCLSITHVPLSLDFQVSHKIEVIGNIHDNELTEVQKDG